MTHLLLPLGEGRLSHRHYADNAPQQPAVGKAGINILGITETSA
ncbi:hypothetical protein [Arthrobacter sp. ISL-5]|nr:hypothetical protein [Arthrobacter sp. ISL-5]